MSDRRKIPKASQGDNEEAAAGEEAAPEEACGLLCFFGVFDGHGV